MNYRLECRANSDLTTGSIHQKQTTSFDPLKSHTTMISHSPLVLVRRRSRKTLIGHSAQTNSLKRIKGNFQIVFLRMLNIFLKSQIKLYRVLRAFAAQYKEIGYVQGVNYLAATFLTLYSESVH